MATITPTKDNLTGVTATGSNVYNVENYVNLTIHLTVVGGSTGGTLTLLASNDGANFYGIAFIDLASTTTTTAVTSLGVNATTKLVAVQSSLLGIKYLKVTDRITCGTHTSRVAGQLMR